MSANLYEILGIQADATPEQSVFLPLCSRSPYNLVFSPKGVQEKGASDTP